MTQDGIIYRDTGDIYIIIDSIWGSQSTISNYMYFLEESLILKVMDPIYPHGNEADFKEVKRAELKVLKKKQI